ncbi:MAG: hypothetical protein ACI94Y_002029 [Maribacter sp.]|jgi:hypothetical protein
MKKSTLSIISLFILITIGHSQIVHHKSYELLADSRGTGIDQSFSTGGFVHSAIYNPQSVNNNVGPIANPMLLDRAAIILSDLDLNLMMITEFVGLTETSSAHFEIKLYDVQEIPTGGFIAVGSLADHSTGFAIPKALVIRLDATMSVMWSYTYLIHGELKAVTNTGDNTGFIVAGYSTPSMTSTFQTARLIRIDNAGFPIWSSQPMFSAGSGQSIYNDIVRDNEDSNKYYAAGSCLQGYSASGSLIASEVLVTALDENVSVSMPPHTSKWIGRPTPAGYVIAEEGEAIDVGFQGALVVAGRTYYENVTTIPFATDSDALVIGLDKFSLFINWANEYSMLSPNNLTMEKATTLDIDATSEINVGGNKDDESFIIKLDLFGGALLDHRLIDHGTKNKLSDMTRSPDGYTTTGDIYDTGSGSLENVYSYEQEFSANDSCSFPADPFVRNIILDGVNLNTEYIYDIPVENPQLYATDINYDQYVICESDTLTPVDLPCTWETIAYSSFEPGWHVWNDGGMNARRNIADAAYAEAGNYCIRLRGKTASAKMTSDVFDLTNYEEIKIRFSYITRFHTNTWDDLYLEMSDDGGTTFSILKKWRYVVDYDNDIRETAHWNITGPFTPTTVFRIRSHASNNWDKVYIDNVKIRGCRTAGTRLAAPNQENLELSTIEEGMTREDPQEEGLTKKLDKKGSDASLLVSNVYPNPTRDKINLAYATKEIADVNITIADVAGKIVFNRQINNTQGNQMEIIDVTKFHGGYYMIIIESGENREVQKFVKL